MSTESEGALITCLYGDMQARFELCIQVRPIVSACSEVLVKRLGVGPNCSCASRKEKDLRACSIYSHRGIPAIHSSTVGTATASQRFAEVLEEAALVK